MAFHSRIDHLRPSYDDTESLSIEQQFDELEQRVRRYRITAWAFGIIAAGHFLLSAITKI